MTLPKAALPSAKNKTQLVFGTHHNTQAVLVFRAGAVTDVFYQSNKNANLVGLVATAKITEVTGSRVFAALPNGAMGWLETKQKIKAGDIVRVRVSSYVQPPKAWPMKLADDLPTAAAPSLIERSTAFFPLSLVREDYETVADWLATNNGNMDLAEGASLIVEQTAAITTIDLNSGRQKNVAQLIAVFGPAVADALRRYQLGGAIVVDAAFLAVAARKGLADKIKKHLATDPLKAKVIGVTKMGLIEIIRPRMGPSLFEAL